MPLKAERLDTVFLYTRCIACRVYKKMPSPHGASAHTNTVTAWLSLYFFWSVFRLVECSGIGLKTDALFF